METPTDHDQIHSSYVKYLCMTDMKHLQKCITELQTYIQSQHFCHQHHIQKLQMVCA